MITPDPIDSSVAPCGTAPRRAAISSASVSTRRLEVTLTTDGPMIRASIVKSLPTGASSVPIAASRIAASSARVRAY